MYIALTAGSIWNILHVQAVALKYVIGRLQLYIYATAVYAAALALRKR